MNFVDSSAFKTQIPCFNATTEETKEQAASGTTSAAGATSTATSDGNGKVSFGVTVLGAMVVAIFGAMMVL